MSSSSSSPSSSSEHLSEISAVSDVKLFGSETAGEIKKKYGVGDEIFAVGGDSVIYQGIMAISDTLKPVVIKVTSIQGDTSLGHGEGQILADLCHPNIVRLLEHVQDVNCHYLVLEFIDGISLAQLFQAGIPISPSQVLAIMQQVLRAMMYYQDRGITHNDLHLGNVMIQATTGQIKIIDFGDATRSGKFTHDLRWLGQLLDTLHVEDGEVGECPVAFLRRLLTSIKSGPIPPWLPEHGIFNFMAGEESLTELVHTTIMDSFPFRLGGLLINHQQRYQLGHLADDVMTKFDIELVPQTGKSQGLIKMLAELSTPSHHEMFSSIAIPGANLNFAIAKPLEVASRHQHHWLIFLRAPRAGRALHNAREVGRGDRDGNERAGEGEEEDGVDIVSPVNLFQAAIMAIKRLHTHGLSLVGDSPFASLEEGSIPKMEALLVMIEQAYSRPEPQTSDARLRPRLEVRLNGHSMRLTGGAEDAEAIQKDLLFLAAWGRILTKSKANVIVTRRQLELITRTVGELERAAYGQGLGGRTALDNAITYLVM